MFKLNFKNKEDMDSSKEILNDALVGLFNQVLLKEESYMKSKMTSALTLNNVHILEAVNSFENCCTMSELAGKLRVTVSTLSTNIKKLIDNNYLLKRQSKADKRVFYVKLTQKGNKILKIHEEYHKKMIDLIATNLSNKETADLIDLLSKIKYFFSE